MIVLFSSAAALAIGVLAALFFLLRHIRRVARYAAALAEGKYAEPPSVPNGALAELLFNLRELSSRLHDEVGKARDEKNRILAILEAMTEGVLLVDGEQRVTLLNPALSRMLEWPSGEAEGRYFWEIFRDPNVNEMISQAIAERSQARREQGVLFSDAVFQIHVSPVFSQREFLGVVVVFYDVTRLKKLEKVRSEFAANVSHELKTPLTSVLGFVETLKQGAVEDPKNRMSFLDVIEANARRLYRLIEDLLLLSRLESDKGGLGGERVEVGPLLGRVLDAFKPAMQEGGISCEARVEPERLAVTANPLLLEQALFNLIDNAVKYNTPGGRLSVRAASDGSHVRFEVEDTGSGIPEKDLERIFERFYRVEKSRSSETGGTGLGLSIVKHIAESHGGRVEARSVPGRGSVFTLILPQ